MGSFKDRRTANLLDGQHLIGTKHLLGECYKSW